MLMRLDEVGKRLRDTQNQQGFPTRPSKLSKSEEATRGDRWTSTTWTGMATEEDADAGHNDGVLVLRWPRWVTLRGTVD